MTMCLHEWTIFWLLLRMEELMMNSFTHAGSSPQKPLWMRTLASSQNSFHTNQTCTCNVDSDRLTLLAASATPADGKPWLCSDSPRVMRFVSSFSSRSHQPGAEGEIHPPWRRSSGPDYVPLPGPTLQTRLAERLADPLLVLRLPQWCLSALSSLCSHHTNSFSIIQGE